MALGFIICKIKALKQLSKSLMRSPSNNFDSYFIIQLFSSIEVQPHEIPSGILRTQALSPVIIFISY